MEIGVIARVESSGLIKVVRPEETPSVVFRINGAAPTEADEEGQGYSKFNRGLDEGLLADEGDAEDLEAGFSTFA